MQNNEEYKSLVPFLAQGIFLVLLFLIDDIEFPGW